MFKGEFWQLVICQGTVDLFKENSVFCGIIAVNNYVLNPSFALKNIKKSYIVTLAESNTLLSTYSIIFVYYIPCNPFLCAWIFS